MHAAVKGPAMIDLDDLIDDLNESAAQSYDELSQATIDVLHRAVAAIEELRPSGAALLREAADEIDAYYPPDLWPTPDKDEWAELHAWARSKGSFDASRFHVSGIRHALGQVRRIAGDLERQSTQSD